MRLMRSSFPGGFQPLGFQRNRGPRYCCWGCPIPVCTLISLSAHGLLCIHFQTGCSSPHPTSLTTPGSCHSKKKIAVVQPTGLRKRITRGMLQKPSWHAIPLKAGWGRRWGAEGDGRSWRLTRGCIVPGPISWFLIHPQPTRHDQITAGPRISFPVHLVLGIGPGFGNTW